MKKGRYTLSHDGVEGGPGGARLGETESTRTLEKSVCESATAKEKMYTYGDAKVKQMVRRCIQNSHQKRKENDDRKNTWSSGGLPKAKWKGGLGWGGGRPCSCILCCA